MMQRHQSLYRSMQWSVARVVMLIGIVLGGGSNGWTADMDPASLLGTWSGDWRSTAGGGLAGAQGPAEFAFTKVEADKVNGTFRLTSATGSRAGSQFIGRENDFSGTITGTEVEFRGSFPPGRLNVSGQEITGRLGENVTFRLRKK